MFMRKASVLCHHIPFAITLFFLEGGKFPLISKFWQTLVFVSVKDKGRSFDDNTLNQFPNTNSSSDARLWFWVNVKVTCYVIWQSLKVSTVLPTVCIKSRWKFQQSYQQCVYRVCVVGVVSVFACWRVLCGLLTGSEHSDYPNGVELAETLGWVCRPRRIVPHVPLGRLAVSVCSVCFWSVTYPA